MRQRIVSAIAFSCFLLGFLGLWISTERQQTIPIESISIAQNGQRVQVEGIIESGSVSGSHAFFKLRDGNALNAVYYNVGEEKSLIQPGKKVRVRGLIEFQKSVPRIRVTSLERLD